MEKRRILKEFMIQERRPKCAGFNFVFFNGEKEVRLDFKGLIVNK